MIFNQIYDAINIGLVIMDRNLIVVKWNRWMEEHSGIPANRIIGTHIFEAFPNLDNPNFRRSCKSVLSFGNFCFFSQKFHRYLFPFTSDRYFKSSFNHMQQSCAMGPLRNEENVIENLFISVQDVTEVAEYQKKLIEANKKDGLTGVFNRGYLEEKMRDEFNRCRRYGGDFSMIMFDIDYFKKVNDEHGHLCGDFILREISSTIQSLIRTVDCLARYGGEEFCCILPETDLDGAAMVAERFRVAVAEMSSEFEGSLIPVTVSLGVSAYTPDTDSPQQLIKRADTALYRAKREGRNRSIIFFDEVVK